MRKNVLKILAITFALFKFEFAHAQDPSSYLTAEILEQILIQQQVLLTELSEQVTELERSTAPAGNALTFHYCNDRRYDCTPKQCLNYCIAKGKRMATRDEVFTHALDGQNSCRFVWMADAANSKSVFVGYPMFNYQGFGCVNTVNLPIMADVRPTSWDSNEKFDCACAQ